MTHGVCVRGVGAAGRDDHSVENDRKQGGAERRDGPVVANVFRAAAEAVGLRRWLGRAGMQW